MFTMAATLRIMASTVGLLPVSREKTRAQDDLHYYQSLFCHYLILMVDIPAYHSKKKTFLYPLPLFEMQCTGEKIKTSYS